MLFSNINILMPDFTILKNAYLGTKNDKICYISNKPPSEKYNKIYNGQNKLIMPGLINTHCHVPMTLLRSCGADLNLEKWLNNAIFPIESKLTGKFVYFGAMIGIAELIRSGVTAFNDMYFFGENILSAVKESGIKANLSIGVVNTDNLDVKHLPYLIESQQLFKKYHNFDNGRIKVDMCIHAEYTSNPETVTEVGEYAKQNNINTQIHLSETYEETQNCIKKYGKTPTEYFDSLGFFDTKCTAAHCVHVSENDINILFKKGVTVAHCPISNLKLGSGIAPIAKMLEKNINVTIGTDGAASNDNLNMLEDIKITALLQKGINNDPTLLNSKQVLKMATINGALSQGRYDTGQIKEGFKADLCVIDFNDINMCSSNDIISTYVYSAIPQNIKLTMVNGKVLYKDNTFFTIDIEKILYEINKIKQNK